MPWSGWFWGGSGLVLGGFGWFWSGSGVILTSGFGPLKIYQTIPSHQAILIFRPAQSLGLHEFRNVMTI